MGIGSFLRRVFGRRQPARDEPAPNASPELERAAPVREIRPEPVATAHRVTIVQPARTSPLPSRMSQSTQQASPPAKPPANVVKTSSAAPATPAPASRPSTASVTAARVPTSPAAGVRLPAPAIAAARSAALSAAAARASTPAASAPRPSQQPAPSVENEGTRNDGIGELSPPLLKNLQRRLAWREQRLRPKTSTAPHTVTARRPSKQSFSLDEARRLFSITLRTRNRAVRDLASDVEQLERYGLPIWKTEQDVAAALDISVRTLRHFSTHSAKDWLSHYVTFAIPKRTGGERLIMAPKARLKALQRRLNTLLIAKLPVSAFAHGFRTGHSVRSNAEPHVGKRVVLRLDIHDFFGTLHFGRVRGLLISLGYSYPVAATLSAIMTEAPRQAVSAGDTIYFPPIGPRACPQGAPTSPGISNAILMKMDHRLAGCARRFGFSYSRYADDLTFSGNDIAHAHALRLQASRVVEEEGFTINVRKTRLLRAGSRQSVTGVVVNDVLGLSRQDRRRLRAAIHQCALAQSRGTVEPQVLARLEGKLSYLQMLNPKQAQRLAST